MKKNLISLLSFTCAMCLFSACEEDDNTPFSVPAEPVTFKSGEGLNFTSAGNTVDNAQVTYMPDATDNLKGELIVALLDAARSEAMEILPGSTSVTLPITMEKGLDNATFSGNSETDYCTFKYDGSFSNQGISLNFSDVTKKEGIDIPGYNMTYTDASGLRLSYNGNPLLGKKVTVMTEPGAETATIVLSGETLDLSQLAGMMPASNANQQPGLEDILNISTCGVIPGSVVETLTVNINADKEFNGEAETDFVTYKYAGKIADNGLEFNITEATLKNAALAGTTWVLSRTEYDYDDEFNLIGSPVHFRWESAEMLMLGEGNPVPGNFIVNMMLTMAIIPVGEQSTSVVEILPMVLNSVTFLPDGNVVAKYMDIANGATVPTDSPVNIAQYVLTSDNMLKLYLNPQAIIANAIASAGKSRANVDLTDSLPFLIETFVPMVANGFPLEYNLDSNQFSVFLNSDIMIPLAKIAGGILSDEEIQNEIIASIPPEFGMFAMLAEPLIKSLPGALLGTTKFEVGLSFVKPEL